MEVRTPRVLPFLPKNHFHSQRYGPFTEDRDEAGELFLPDDPPAREPIGNPSTHLEPPARVRFPPKRITTAEIRKRVRNLLDYVGRVQVEEGKRKERAKVLGIKIGSLSPPSRLHMQGDSSAVDEDNTMDVDGPMEAREVKRDFRSSSELLGDLTRDLIACQETFAQGGFASPFQPSIPNFPSISPITPTFASGPRMDLIYPNLEAADIVDQVGEDEAVNVYREGKIDMVVTQEHEQQASNAIQAEVETKSQAFVI